MSSWDRARSIPWSHVSEIDGDDMETQKEVLQRQITAQALEEATLELQEMEHQHQQSSTPQQQQITNTITKTTTPPYQTSELLKMAAFGGCIGSITGAVFGFMDGMRTAGESTVLKHASSSAKGKYILQGTTRSGTLFGVFFGGYHVLKYGLRVTMDPGQVTEIGLAGMASLGLMTVKPSIRPSLPYAGMLISMDAFSIFMREMDKH